MLIVEVVYCSKAEVDQDSGAEFDFTYVRTMTSRRSSNSNIRVSEINSTSS